jgi:hypothetical protein
MYTFRYGIIKPSDISSQTGKPGRYRNLKPDVSWMQKLEAHNKFYSRLEASILEEGVRNPIFANSVSSGTHCRYGISRLWTCSKHGIELPIIIADYVGAWEHFRELKTDDEIKDLYDIPIWIVRDGDEVTITPVPPGTTNKQNVLQRDMMSDLKEREQAKYEKVWRNRNYRKTSPGERSCMDFEEWSGKSGSVADLGCGTGRAAIRLGTWHAMTLVDHAENCRDRAAERFPFYQQCLWELDIPHHDYAFCCDVMEHIPEEKVDEVLDRIAACADKAYLRIFLMPDNGKFIDEPLHLTVKPMEWWEEKIKSRWSTYTVDHSEMVATFKAEK